MQWLIIFICNWRRHKKHRSKHKHKGSESDSEESEEVTLIDELLESRLEAAVSDSGHQPEGGRDVEMVQTAAGNGLVESMKIIVNNHNNFKSQVSHCVFRARDLRMYVLNLVIYFFIIAKVVCVI